MAYTIRISRVVGDIVVIACCAIPLLLFELLAKPYKRGFYCDDESIRYPFRKSQVSRQICAIVGTIVGLVIIIITEIFRVLVLDRKYENEFVTYMFKGHDVHRIVVRLYCFIGYFLLGIVFNQLLVDIGKYTIGRQRPHFMDVCQPSRGYNECTTPNKYITDFTCTGTDQYLINESMLSFFSGHSAFSFYVAWFCSLYLRARIYRPVFSRILVPAIQFLLLGTAGWVALTRISDYKHHWSDVLVGALLGSAVGILMALFVAEVFDRREIPTSYSSLDKLSSVVKNGHIIIPL
ncbi:unnamed protein product [Cylicocyclus nassatus]|uniref:Phosphatidic acid phosphatase type 2/haloperoxidase domain-containing protein n=1 Tax=Cylicocyclus nassatus TaxID=53992 RepID=A0AA36H8P0_CYLNA|nr:unnamed protein product [Cylicocyclus nassatus]